MKKLERAAIRYADAQNREDKIQKELEDLRKQFDKLNDMYNQVWLQKDEAKKEMLKIASEITKEEE